MDKRSQVNAFHCTSIGLGIGKQNVYQKHDGTWIANSKIGSIFGTEVEGKLEGTGKTKEEALRALAKERRELNDSLWF